MKRFILFILLVVSVTSCKKSFLDVPDNSVVVQQTYVVNLQATKEYLNGIYAMLGRDLYSSPAQIYPELVADNIKISTATSSLLAIPYRWTQKSSLTTASESMNSTWLSVYAIIYASNFVIEKAEEFKTENEAEAGNIKGQAYAIRALAHFTLVNIFAQPYNFTAGASHPGVPYVETSDRTKPFSRQSVNEVYAKLISDLSNAVQLLPGTVANTAKINRNTAKALLARVYFYKGSLNEAKNLAVEVAGAVPLLSIANGYPNNLFRNLPPAQTEVLFQLAPGISASLGTSVTTQFPGRYFRGTGSAKSFVATTDISSILTENPADVRKAWVTNSSGTVWDITKFPAGIVTDITGTAANGAYFAAVVRSSEMYLIAAEAFAKTGDENSARAYLDAIRKRANPAAATTILTGDALLELIYRERRKEFAFEGFRMYELQRLNKSVVRADGWFSDAKNLAYPNERAISPIPGRDVVAGLSQNPGY